jgi:hypothetical protein
LPPSPPKTGTGKQAGSIRPTDTEKHTETEQATNETVDDSLPAIKSAPQTHIGKLQIAASESDKPPAQARGEAQTDGPLRADGATADSGDPGMAGPKPTIDSATQLLTATGHASSGPNALTSQPGSQPTALAYVGATVIVDGSTAQLTGGNANWSLNVTKQCRQLQSLSRIRPVRTSIPAPLQSIPARRVSPGTAAATTAVSGPTAPIPSIHGSRHQQAIGCHFRGTGDRRFCRSHAGAAQLSINGQNYTLDKIKRIVRPTT